MSAPENNPYEGREAVMFDFACDARDRGEHFYYVRIPGDIGPLERGERFEDALDATLHDAGLGGVTGGGSQLGDGSTIKYCGIDVLVVDPEKGLQVLVQELRRLGVPLGTVIESYLPTRVDYPVYDDGEQDAGPNRRPAS
jgi:hypothetical protein